MGFKRKILIPSTKMHIIKKIEKLAKAKDLPFWVEEELIQQSKWAAQGQAVKKVEETLKEKGIELNESERKILHTTGLLYELDKEKVERLQKLIIEEEQK